MKTKPKNKRLAEACLFLMMENDISVEKAAKELKVDPEKAERAIYNYHWNEYIAMGGKLL